jgi:hypothetical protein
MSTLEFTLVSFFILKVGLNTINKSINIFFIPMGMGDGSRVQPTEMSCAYQIADGYQTCTYKTRRQLTLIPNVISILVDKRLQSWLV